MEKINEEVISILVKLTKNIIGDKAVELILKDLGEDISGRQLVFAFAEKIQDLFGEKGGFSTMRQLGREVAKTMMEQNQKENWEKVMEQALNELGFAERVEREENAAYICKCVFYEILDDRSLKPTEHSVCWAGWGFIEGFAKHMYGAKGVQWKERDYENEKCKFEYIRA
ncbi:hypothetical protein [Persephonella sp.]|uniref:hypothetical protein n=1 Tax=Persephonella sp. TaxID=2060922 RepID=UPI00260E565C|nr:hypothetical protein [Persephonella sp.]